MSTSTLSTAAIAVASLQAALRAMTDTVLPAIQSHCRDNGGKRHVAHTHYERLLSALRPVLATVSKAADEERNFARGMQANTPKPAPVAAESVKPQATVQTAKPAAPVDTVDVAGMSKPALEQYAKAHGIRLPLGAGRDRMVTVIQSALAKPAAPVAATVAPVADAKPAAPVAAPVAATVAPVATVETATIAIALEQGTLGAMKRACDALGIQCKADTGAMRTALTERLNGTVAPVADAKPAPVAKPATKPEQGSFREVQAKCKALSINAKGSHAELLVRLTAHADKAKPAPVAAETVAPQAVAKTVTVQVEVATEKAALIRKLATMSVADLTALVSLCK